MASVTFRGKRLQTSALLPATGSHAPDFILTNAELAEVHLKDFRGKKIVLDVFISIDTPTCAKAAHHFNKIANQMKNVIVMAISADLPFALKRFCSGENLSKIIPLSTFRHPEFGQRYGLTIVDGPLAGLLSRAVIIIDENGRIIYTEQVAEISHEPDYSAVVKALQ